MSTIKVNTITDASGGSNVVLQGVASPPNGMGFRNRIINGSMVIDQRNNGASVTPTTNQYTLDRWEFFVTQSSKVSFQQNAGSVTPPAGFKNYLGLTVGASANVTVGSTDLFILNQFIEGFNIADLGFGAAGASAVTLSFYVRSSLTGTFGGSLTNSGNSRSHPFTYTISSANTWEQKTLTVSGDTAGTWLSTNGTGLGVRFSIGTGSTYLGTSGSWASASYFGATGQTNLVTTNSATFFITGVQLEAGSVASPFERRDIGCELMMCQRYFANIVVQSGQFGAATGMNQNTTTSFFPTQRSFRASPTVTFSGGLNVIQGNTASPVTSVAAAHFSQLGVNVGLTCSGASFSAGSATTLFASGSTSSLNMSAEL